MECYGADGHRMPPEAAWGLVAPHMLVGEAVGGEEIYRARVRIALEGGTLCFTFKRLPNRMSPSPLSPQPSARPSAAGPFYSGLPPAFAHKPHGSGQRQGSSSGDPDPPPPHLPPT
jgi:hypothetical protein